MIAAMDEARVVPCWIEELTASAFDSATAKLVPARFDSGWKRGLAALTQQLETGAVPRLLEPGTGRRIALGAYQVEPLTQAAKRTRVRECVQGAGAIVRAGLPSGIRITTNSTRSSDGAGLTYSGGNSCARSRQCQQASRLTESWNTLGNPIPIGSA